MAPNIVSQLSGASVVLTKMLTLASCFVHLHPSFKMTYFGMEVHNDATADDHVNCEMLSSTRSFSLQVHKVLADSILDRIVSSRNK